MKNIEVFQLEDCEEDAYLLNSVLYPDEQYRFEIKRFSTLAELESALHSNRPDVLIVDLNLNECIGLETLKKVKLFSGNLPVVVISNVNDSYFGEDVMALGAADFIPKLESRSQVVKRSLVHAIHRC